MKLRYHLIILFLIIANICDVYSTSIIVGSNLQQEINPVARVIIHEFGYSGFLFIKLLLLAVVWGLLVFHFRKKSTIPWIPVLILSVAVGVYTGICIHNLYILSLINM